MIDAERMAKVPEEQVCKIQKLLDAMDHPKHSVNMHMDHVFWCQNKKCDEIWKGRVIQMKRKAKTGDHMIRVSYNWALC